MPRELFKRDRRLFFEAVRSRVVSDALRSVIGHYDEFVLDVAVFTPYRVIVEEDAEVQLFAYLNSLYPGLVERQKRLPDGSRIDIAMLGYGVEVKFFDKFNKVELDRAVGQSMNYTDYFERVVLTIYYTSDGTGKRIREKVSGLPLREPGVSVVLKKVKT